MNDFYLITFTPLGRFYFGSSNSWGESFYASSLMFPTQTTILGCLRRTLLKQNGLLDGRYPRKGSGFETITGKSPANGFDEKELDIGIIKKLSPVFIIKHNPEKTEEILFPLPADVYKSENKIRTIQYEKNINASTNRDSAFAFKKIYEGKTYLAQILGNKNFWDKYIKGEVEDYDSGYDFEKIILPSDQPGIAREGRNKIDEAFYRKKDFIMADGFSFGIIAETDEKIVDKLKDDFVFMGGEQSKFLLRVLTVDESVKQKFPSGFEKFFNSYNPKDSMVTTSQKKLVLLSHLFYEGLLGGIEHSVIENMETIRSLNESGHKTYSFRVIPAGSVIYTDGNFSFNNIYKFASKIGYNFFIEINQEIK